MPKFIEYDISKYKILSKMEDDRVFNITPLDDGFFMIQERCEGYYTSIISEEDLASLANELLFLISEINKARNIGKKHNRGN